MPAKGPSPKRVALQIEMLSMARVKQARSAELGQGWMEDAVAFVPMIAMLVVRSCRPLLNRKIPQEH